VAGARTPEQKLFGAAVLRRSFELRGAEQAQSFRAVYEGVLRDLGLTDDAVAAYLAAHRAEVDEAIGRGRGA